MPVFCGGGVVVVGRSIGWLVGRSVVGKEKRKNEEYTTKTKIRKIITKNEEKVQFMEFLQDLCEKGENPQCLKR